MGLPKNLVKKLACPKCHLALEYQAEKDRLLCRKCALAFRVVDDIPVLVIDEAEELH